MGVHLTDEPNSFVWHLTSSGVFSVKSLYEKYLNEDSRYLQKYIWKLKVSLKIRIFMWFLHKSFLLTKDNLLKRIWIGCKKCAFCDSEESVEYLFLKCNFAKLLCKVVHYTFNIPPPTNIKNLFASWLNGIDKITKSRIRVGVGQFGMAVLNSCRLFTKLSIG
jgi:hypothetical protein